MPSLASLPSPTTADLPNYNNNRWNALPHSGQALMELITAGARTKQNATGANLSTPNKTTLQFPRILSKTEYVHLGDFLRQEHLAGSSQILCHYRNISSSTDRPSTISLICELGCCPDVSGGCCTLSDPSGKTPTSYHWVVILLSVFVLFVFISTLAMFVLYWTNRRRERKLLQQRMLSEKCFSVLSSPEGNYATSSVLTPDGPSRGQQQPFSPQFWHFFNQPSIPNPANLLRLDQMHQLSHNHQHGHQHHLHSPLSSSSSTYHAPAEMYFRSVF
uniref:Uncharacterized protein n=1 Tax=Globodera rostochiensis TaxID=31243 RepID=A0A914H0A8_GLORO